MTPVTNGISLGAAFGDYKSLKEENDANIVTFICFE